MSREKTWSEIVEPTVKKLELAATLNMNTKFNAKGSEALGELIKRMAARLDADLETIEKIK